MAAEDPTAMASTISPFGKAAQDIALSTKVVAEPPLVRAQSEKYVTASPGGHGFLRGKSDNNISSSNSSGVLQISDTTRRIIEDMDKGQVQNAMDAFEIVKQRRRQSQEIIIKRASIRKLEFFDSDNDGDEEKESHMTGELSENKRIEQARNDVDNDLKPISEKEPTEADPPIIRRAPRRRNGLARSLISATKNTIKPPTFFDSVEDGEDSAANNFDDLSIHTEGPVKSSAHAHSDNRRKSRGNNGAGAGMGGLLSKFSKSITGAAARAPPPKVKKPADGATYFRRGKRKAEKCLFLEAVALFNFALEKQREELGEDHLDCATTLNEIGNAWMMLDEKYPAL